MTSIWFVSRTRAIFRRAEFGFFGVIVRTCRHTPRFWGAPGIGTWRCRRLFQFLRRAGALTFSIFGFRPWRTSWLMVGTETRLLSLSVTSGGGRSGGSTRAGGPAGDRSDLFEACSDARGERGPLEATKAEFSKALVRVSNTPGRGAGGVRDCGMACRRGAASRAGPDG